MTAGNRSFLGQDWAFPVSLATGTSAAGVELVDGAQNVRQSILLILQTERGERVMRPNFGAGLRAMLYGVNNGATRALIRHRVEEALIRYEPRINVDAVAVRTAAGAPNILEIEIGYTIRKTNTFYNFVYPFFLQEERA